MKPVRRSNCPGACALDLVGDKWTLLVVRDLLRGRHTFKELLAGSEGIPTNILADRLKKMEDAAIIVARPYQQKPVRWRYELTAKGRDLGEVLGAIGRWGEKHVKGANEMPAFMKALG